MHQFFCLQHGKSGAPKEKIFQHVAGRGGGKLQWSNASKSFFGGIPEVGSVNVADFIEVRKGMHTEVCVRARASNRTLDPLCFLSVVTMKRTIDLQCASGSDRDLLYRSLQGICNEYKLSVAFS